jgi:hypothetical protein
LHAFALDQEWCYSVQVPSGYKEQGVEANDVVIFVATQWYDENFIASAGHCSIDDYGRPIAGLIVFNSRYLHHGSDIWGRDFSIAVHEMTHVLAFSNEHYDMFLNSSGMKYDNVVSVETTTNEDGETRTVAKLVTPTVISEAQAHFDCATLDGLRLEDFGQSKAGSHWESR